MKKVIKIIFVAIVFFIIILRLYPIGFGTTGLRPTLHGCIGIELWTTDVHTYFPNGNVEFAGFAYDVDDSKYMFWVDGYCLGKDVYLGE